MRSFILIALALFSLHGISFSATPAEDFDAANRLFEGGKFAEAKRGYEALVARGSWSANLFYNLGNAEFRLGESGAAALDYERALALEPGHAEAAQNLRFVRERAGSRIAEPRWWEMLFPSVRGDVFAIAASAAGWLAVVTFLAALLTRGPAPMGLWCGFLFALALAIYAGAGVWRDARNASLGVVIAKQADAKAAPADRSALAETLTAGSRVRVLSERGEWVYCELPAKGRGWLPAASVRKVRL